MLTDFYDGTPVPYQRELLQDGFKIEEAAFSIQSTSNLAWLLNAKTAADIESGFLARFMIVPAYKVTGRKQRQPPSDKLKRKRLVEILEEIYTIKGVFQLTNEAIQIYDNWYDEIADKNYPKKVEIFIERLFVICIKIAMMLEINYSMSLKISKNSMKEACMRTQWLINAIRKLYDEEFTFSKFEEETKKVKNALRTNNNQLYKSDIINTTRLSVKVIDEILKTLEEGEEITREYIRGTTKPKWLITLLK